MRASKAIRAGKKSYKGRQGMAQRQPGKERYKGGRKNTKAGQERCKSRQGKPKFKIKMINPINLYRRG
jgi:hypothetical protein